MLPMDEILPSDDADDAKEDAQEEEIMYAAHCDFGK